MTWYDSRVTYSGGIQLVCIRNLRYNILFSLAPITQGSLVSWIDELSIGEEATRPRPLLSMYRFYMAFCFILDFKTAQAQVARVGFFGNVLSVTADEQIS